MMSEHMFIIRKYNKIRFYKIICQYFIYYSNIKCILIAGFTGVFGALISVNEDLLVWYRLLFTTVILFFTI